MKLDVFQIKLSEFIHGLRSYRIDELRVEERMKNCELWYGLGMESWVRRNSPNYAFRALTVHQFTYIFTLYVGLLVWIQKASKQLNNNVCGSSYDEISKISFKRFRLFNQRGPVR